MRVITVNLDERSYPMYLGSGILSSFAEVYRQLNLSETIAIVTDKNVARLHLRSLKNILRHHHLKAFIITIMPGEAQKSLRRANKVYTRLLNEHFPRNGTLISFGGGVVGDLTGFVAATYHRGTQLVHIPTTLLAQIESSLGGKTAVNHPLSKNAIGAFYQPSFVYTDVQLLSTLPQREVISGVGELLKYAYLNETMFAFIEEHLNRILALDLDVLEETIFRCASLKAEMVSDDEKETKSEGGRMVLNLGHTIGHALENLSNYKLRHGEAVLLGLRYELEIASKSGILSENDYIRLSRLIRRVELYPKFPLPSIKSLIKKLYAHGSIPSFVLPKMIGTIIQTDEIKPDFVKSVLEEFKQKKVAEINV